MTMYHDSLSRAKPQHASLVVLAGIVVRLTGDTSCMVRRAAPCPPLCSTIEVYLCLLTIGDPLLTFHH